MVRRLPVGVLIGIAEARHAQRRRVSERAAKVGRSGACADRRLERVNDPGRIVTEQLLGERRVVRPAMRAGPATNRSGSWLVASSHSATRSTGWRHAVDSSAPRAATIWPTTVGSKAGACCQPIRSRHSNALLMKSSECPVSANARSVSAASRHRRVQPAGNRPRSPSVGYARRPRGGAPLSSAATSA